MNKYAVIVAAGAGLRMNSAVPKQFLALHGKPVIWHTVVAFLHAFPDLRVVLVLPADGSQYAEKLMNDEMIAARTQVVQGGNTRFQSVKNGLALVPDDAIVFIHDGVRCLVTAALIHACYGAAVQTGNAIPATRAIDSVRLETDRGHEILDRKFVRLIQTPQTFQAAIVKKAYQQEDDAGFTDDASVVQKTGVAIHLVDGDVSNIKITSPSDLLLAETLLAQRTQKI